MENEINYDPDTSPRYTGPVTFMRTASVRDPSKVDIALIGVPYDGGVENRSGPRQGPREIRNMSSFMRTIYHVTRVNPYKLCRIADMGDVPFTNPFDIGTSYADITEFYRKVHAAGAVPLSAGGDHSISLPILRALAAEGPLGMLHIDAHTDTADQELGSRLSHGTPFRRAVEEGSLDPKRTVQIGIRGAQNSEEGWDVLKRIRHAGHLYRGVYENGPGGCDCRGPAYRRRRPDLHFLRYRLSRPGIRSRHRHTGGGGMTPIQAQGLLRGLRGLNLIGGDVVEVSPPFDPSGNTALVGATMMFEILCVLAEEVARGKSKPAGRPNDCTNSGDHAQGLAVRMLPALATTHLFPLLPGLTAGAGFHIHRPNPLSSQIIVTKIALYWAYGKTLPSFRMVCG